ncbi:MAG: SRPBCC domain-containing protein [Rhodobacteraceae bacterium]|jgi:uncharacterized protein YndB with AHSA1/START domain|nr:SRPBCC domain-containing protein [Paracoccaceae bacterium]
MAEFAIAAAGDTGISISRHFAAPVADLVKAHLEPDLLMRWMAIPEAPLTLCEVDARPGGGFRYAWAEGPEGTMALTGTFLEMTMAENGDSHIVHTETFAPDWTGGPTLVDTRLTATPTGSALQLTITYASTPARDGALASEMGDSMAVCYQQLDRLLAG